MLFHERYVKNIVLALYLLLPTSLAAQVYPAEAASLHALRFPLRAEKISKASRYVFKIAAAEHEEDRSFEHSIFLTISDTDNVVIAQLPQFDQAYSWRVEGYSASGKKIAEGSIHHFRVLANRYSDTSKYRVRVLKNSYDKELYFTLDHSGGIYGLDGKPVWFSPQIISNEAQYQSTNLELSTDNTITFLLNERAYETNYNGDVLWQSPLYLDNGQPNKVHHEYVKLKNGNYMMLTWETENREIVVEGVTEPGKSSPVSFGVIEEFDVSGKLVWRWSSSNCFNNDQLIDLVNGTLLRPRGRTHANAFFFDETDRVVFLGFKDVSKMVKISYPDGKILGTIEGLIGRGQPLFVEQHSINMRNDRSLLIFSNNISVSVALPNVTQNKIKMDSAVSSIVLLRPDENGDYSKVMEVKCDLDKTAAAWSGRGGNVKELPDGNFFVCMGGSNRIFITSPAGEILYNAVVEMWEPGSAAWNPFTQYRAMPVRKADLDKAALRSLLVR